MDSRCYYAANHDIYSSRASPSPNVGQRVASAIGLLHLVRQRHKQGQKLASLHTLVPRLY